MGRLHSGQLCDAGETVLFGKVSVEKIPNSF